MLFGAHVSTRGGIHNAVTNATAIGADLFQMHPSSAQQWRRLRLDEDVRATYLQRYATSGLRGHWLHAVYLVNLATPREELLRQSIGSLLHHMRLAAQLGADGVVFHTGSHLGAGFATAAGQVAAAVAEVLDQSPPGPRLLIENSAGSGGCVGCSFTEVGTIVDAVGSPRLGVCLDTQHLFASGYDVRTPAAVASTLDAFASEVGFARLALVHANDSRTPLGSHVDRHANIGEGEIGLGGFRLLLRDERLRAVPWILETPGENRNGPDRANLNRLRVAAGEAPLAEAKGDEVPPRAPPAAVSAAAG